MKRQIGLPWMSFGSDAGAPAAEGVFLLSNDHPRAYGNTARLLGKYVRDEKAATLPDAIRRLTSLPVANLGIKERGMLKPGYFADVVVFDPATIGDRLLVSPTCGLAGASEPWTRRALQLVTSSAGHLT